MLHSLRRVALITFRHTMYFLTYMMHGTLLNVTHFLRSTFTFVKFHFIVTICTFTISSNSSICACICECANFFVRIRFCCIILRFITVIILIIAIILYFFIVSIFDYIFCSRIISSNTCIRSRININVAITVVIVVRLHQWCRTAYLQVSVFSLASFCAMTDNVNE